MLSDAPQWLLEQVCDGSPPASDDATALTVDRPLTEADAEAVKREVDRQIDAIRTAKEGTRNTALNSAAFICGKLVGARAVSEPQIEEMLREAAQSVGLTQQEARATIRSGLSAGKRKPWRLYAQNEQLELLNRDHFLALEGKSAFVFREELNAVTETRSLARIRPEAFKQIYGNRFVIVTLADGSTKVLKLGDAWLTWPRRRQYDGVVFVPGMDLPANIYNQWQGFAFDPVKGNCESFLDFVLNVICDGDESLFIYLLSWCARAVQWPWLAGEVAVVFRGNKGIGKTFFAEHLGELFGDHFVVLTNSRHLTGNFNAHLETSVMVFADEAFWAGDKQGESTLKGLITGKFLFVERKGIDGRSVLNRTHVIMASNSDWVVPASLDERRFFVLNVSALRKDDHQYFGQLDADWQNGGREAFLYHLLSLNISDFNVRNVPQTQALLDQKLLSLGVVDRWYYSQLQSGVICLRTWPEWLSTETLFLDYSEYCTKESARIGTREAFGMRFVQLLPPRPSKKPVRCQRQYARGKREWGYELGTLQDCRNHFAKVIGFDLEWETPGEVGRVPASRY